MKFKGKKKEIERKSFKTTHRVKVERKVISERPKQGFNEFLKTIVYGRVFNV